MSNLSGFVKRLRDIMRNDAGINGDAQRIEQIAWMLFLKVYDAKEQDWEFNEDGGDIKVTFIFSDGVYLDLFLDEEEFCDFLGGLSRAEI